MTDIVLCALGHAHLKIIEAGTELVNRVLQVSNLYHITEQAQLAEVVVSVKSEGLNRKLLVNIRTETN